MKFRLEPFVAVAAFAVAAILAPRLAPRAAADQLVNQIVASVDDEPITMHDLREFAVANGTEIPTDHDPKALEAKKAVLKGLITQKLMEQELKKFSAMVDDSTIDRYIAQVEQKNQVTDAQFREELQRRGLTWEEYRGRARIELEKMEMFEKSVRDKVSITPDQVAAYYKSHPKDFTINKERFRLAQILVAVDPKSPSAKVDAARIKAEALRKRAAAGEDFAELARKNSDDDSKSKGGELGYFGTDDILDQIKTAILKLNRGQISEVVESRYGFHIVKVEEHERPGVKPLDQVKDDIREKLSQDAMEVQFKRWLEEDLIKGHHVESYL